MKSTLVWDFKQTMYNCIVGSNYFGQKAAESAQNPLKSLILKAHP